MKHWEHPSESEESQKLNAARTYRPIFKWSPNDDPKTMFYLKPSGFSCHAMQTANIQNQPILIDKKSDRKRKISWLIRFHWKSGIFQVCERKSKKKQAFASKEIWKKNGRQIWNEPHLHMLCVVKYIFPLVIYRTLKKASGKKNELVRLKVLRCYASRASFIDEWSTRSDVVSRSLVSVFFWSIRKEKKGNTMLDVDVAKSIVVLALARDPSFFFFVNLFCRHIFDIQRKKSFLPKSQ